MTFAILGGGQLDTGYTIDNSLRFNQSDDPSLTRTPSSTGNRKTFTWSGWVKRSKINATRQLLFGADNSADTNATYIRLTDDETIQAYIDNNNVLESNLNTSAKYRDDSAWYHIVWAVDTTQATSSNRVKVYINGSLVTSYQTPVYPSQNFDTDINTQEPHYVGGDTTGVANDYALDGYMAEVHFIDGTALDATSFGEFDEDSGIWKPIRYSGSYGTNGFYLDFEDSGSLGADQSGNGNNFTPTNLASTDQVLDSPTNNFCTLNRNATPQNGNLLTFSEGNLKVECPTSDRPTLSTFGMSSGKWYFEAYVTGGSNDHWIGVWKNGEALNGYGSISQTTSASLGLACVYQGNTGGVGYNGSTQYTGSSYTGGDYIGCCFDADNYKVYFHKNGTWQNSADPSAGTGGVSVSDGEWLFYIAANNSGQGWIVNFGQDSTFAGTTTAGGNADENGYGDFKYTVESGFLSLNSANLATELSPTIDDGSQYFNTVLYTGNSTSNRTVTGVGFQPDFTWFKGRTPTNIDHALFDSNRGATKILISNNSSPEITVSESLKSFDSDGVTLGNDLGDYGVNYSGRTYALWSWKVNAGSTSSNTDGSITSTVQLNSTAGFSIVTYTGNGTAGATVGHGLGVTPDMFIIRGRDQAGGWITYHKTVGATKAVALQSSGAQNTSSAYFNNTEPTSSVVSLGYDGPGNEVNNSGTSFVAYCFADIEGYSKFGSYIGNGSTDGPFIYTGFRPAFVIIKVISTTENWVIRDNKRDPYNNVYHQLLANASSTEDTTNDGRFSQDFLSNGFKIRASHATTNQSGQTYIYMAFAENPFVSSTGVPVVAR